MNLRTTIAGRVYYFILRWFCDSLLKDKDLSAVFFTYCGLFFAALVPLGFLVSPWFGMVFIFISGILDSVDGYIARNKNQQSRFGAFLDSTVDRISDFFYLFGFLVFFWFNQFSQRLWFTFLIFISFLFTLLISYTKARIEGLNAQCNTGIMGRAVRVIYLIFLAFSLGLIPLYQNVVLWIGFFLYMILNLFTVVQRIFYAKEVLKD